MSRTAYPTTQDLEQFLTGGGLTLTNALRAVFPHVVNAAKKQFEEDCGRVILAPSADTRRFNPPTNRDRLLILPYDLATLTSIVYVPTNGTSTTFTSGTDFDPEPYNASAETKPYTQIRFYTYQWQEPLNYGVRNSLRIAGRWGYATTVPDDVWLAVLARSAWSAFAQINLANTSGIRTWTDGDRTVAYGFNTLAETWAGSDGRGGLYGQTVSRYRRYTI